MLGNKVTATNADVLRWVHRNSEPFDHELNPATIDTIRFDVGQVAAIDNNGYVVRGNHANLATTVPVGLFVLPYEPQDPRKNNYVLASGNASIFSNGIVILSTQIAEASVNAADVLYLGTDGQISTDSQTDSAHKIGVAMTSRTALGEDVKVKLEL